jgi:GT2 family glycosyltransferase
MIKYSICIVSKNRSQELDRTLKILNVLTKDQSCEILVGLDGCTDDSLQLTNKYHHVKWSHWDTSVGASPARKIIFDKAQGDIIFGFDDDAHPLNPDFLVRTTAFFDQHPDAGVISFEEIKGIYSQDIEAMKEHKEDIVFKCSSFVGCGYAMKRKAYRETNGWPQWMKVYGEEGCLSLELLNLNYDIYYCSNISVNHRVNRKSRVNSGANKFRFEQQLINTVGFYLVYFPSRYLFLKVIKLLYHNLIKYGLKDFKMLIVYLRAVSKIAASLPKFYRQRKVVSKETVRKFQDLSNPVYG